MCGIFGIVNKKCVISASLIKATEIVNYRGPDDEGYLTWQRGNVPKVWAGSDTAPSSQSCHKLKPLESNVAFDVGLGHRRLSIIDLSPAGHQPMLLAEAGLAISFNGEVYNYVEVRKQLLQLGHVFLTTSDTEVILHAWQEWGVGAMQHFNGMFAFLILDWKNLKLFVVRDRFGVKPLYYTETKDYIALASEAKQLRLLPDYGFNLNSDVAYDYLRYGFVDHSNETFESNILQVDPGSYLTIDLDTQKLTKGEWYKLTPDCQTLSEAEVLEKYHDLLKDSIRLRLRSDVPVGTALSGGLDSSTIVCLMEALLKEKQPRGPLRTITSCFKEKKFDEWEYAETIINETGADSWKTYPSFEKLQNDFDSFLWHMDYPFGSTSQFSQWCVFEKAKEAGLTVMLDGQGADEQLAGYGGNDIALYNGLLRNQKYSSLISEIRGYRKKTGTIPKGFLLAAVQKNLPVGIVRMFPRSYRPLSVKKPKWLLGDITSRHLSNEKDLRSHLQWQIQKHPLPSLLRYEDRNSMAFSIESRTPFMDYRLVEFTIGLDEKMIYKQGIRKYVLRESLRGTVPNKILDRRDKMGFVSAEEKWLKDDSSEWFDRMFNASIKTLPQFLDPVETSRYISEMQKGRTEFNFDPWRILCMGNWVKIFK